MGFTFYTRDDISFVREILPDQDVNVAEAGDETDDEKHEGEGVARVHVDPQAGAWVRVQDLGGDCATVHIVLASSSVDPHDYEPTSADAVVFDTAQLVVVNGADYDLWASDLASNAASSPAVVDAGRSSAPPRARIRACGIRRGM